MATISELILFIPAQLQAAVLRLQSLFSDALSALEPFGASGYASDSSTGLNMLAAILTLAYIGKLLFELGEYSSKDENCISQDLTGAKRSLSDQVVKRRVNC